MWAPHAGGHIQVGTSLVWSWTRVQRGWEAGRQCIFGSIGLGLQGIKSHQCVPEGCKAGCLRRQQNKRLHGRPTLCLLRDCLAMPREFTWLLPVRSHAKGIGRKNRKSVEKADEKNRKNVAKAGRTEKRRQDKEPAENAEKASRIRHGNLTAHRPGRCALVSFLQGSPGRLSRQTQEGLQKAPVTAQQWLSNDCWWRPEDTFRCGA